MRTKEINNKVKDTETSKLNEGLIRSSLSSHINELWKPTKWAKIKATHDDLELKRREREERRQRQRQEIRQEEEDH